MLDLNTMGKHGKTSSIYVCCSRTPSYVTSRKLMFFMPQFRQLNNVDRYNLFFDIKNMFNVFIILSPLYIDKLDKCRLLISSTMNKVSNLSKMHQYPSTFLSSNKYRLDFQGVRSCRNVECCF